MAHGNFPKFQRPLHCNNDNPEAINTWKFEIWQKLEAFLFQHQMQLPLDFVENMLLVEYLNHRIYNLMIFLWSKMAAQASHEYSNYPDFLIRRVLITGCPVGFGYFCLLVAKYVDWNDVLLVELEASKNLCPILPFRRDEKKLLIEITETENRLRLALLLAMEIGRFSDKYSYFLTCELFPRAFINAFEQHGIDKFELLMECLINSKECLRFYFFYGPQYCSDSSVHSSSKASSPDNSLGISSHQMNPGISAPTPIRHSPQSQVNLTKEPLTNYSNGQLLSSSESESLDPFGFCLDELESLKLSGNFSAKEYPEDLLVDEDTNYSQILVDEGKLERARHCERLYDELFEGMC
jgi:hypothetical protein